MKKSRFSEEQIIGFLKQADAGMPVKELWRNRIVLSPGPAFTGRKKLSGGHAPTFHTMARSDQFRLRDSVKSNKTTRIVTPNYSIS